MSVKASLINEEKSKNKSRKRKRLYFRGKRTKKRIGSERKGSNKDEEPKNIGNTIIVSKKDKTIDNIIIDDYNFQDPELEAKFFSFHCNFEDLCALSKLKNVGIFNWTMKSLVFGLFWFYRMSTNMEENRNCTRQKPLIFQKYEEFKQSIRKIRSLAQLDKENKKELKKLDRLLPIIKEFVCESCGKITPDSFIALHELFNFALKCDHNRIAKVCLAFALEVFDKHLEIEFPLEPLESFRLFSEHNAEPKPTLTSQDWWNLYEKSIEYFYQGKYYSKLVFRMLGAHGTNDVRNEIIKYDLKEEILAPLFHAEEDDYDSPTSSLSENFTGNKLDYLELEVPEIDLMHVDRPEFTEHSGVFKVTDRYITFIKKIEDYINSGDRSDSLEIVVFTNNGSVNFAGSGLTKAFITSFGCLFKVHPLLLVESSRGSVAVHPMATEQVYAFLANLFGLLASYNYKEEEMELSINWFFNPRYAEFMFDTNLDRIPTIEEIYSFFPHLIKEFEVCCHAPEDLGSHYDLRQEITMTSIINHVNVHQLGQVAEPKNVAELTKLKDKYMKHIQLKLQKGHSMFIRNLNTYIDYKYRDYENFDLLFVRRNELTAEEVLNAIELDKSCMSYMVAYEGKTIYNMKIAFKRMVREMSSDERANLFHFGLGGVPTILGKNILRLKCCGGSSQSWSSTSCSGVLFPPRVRSQESPVSYQMLYDSLRMQSAMDYGSTSGNETHEYYASAFHKAEADKSYYDSESSE
jgi:hypothetical protein